MILYATKLTYDRLHIKPSETLHYAAEEYYPQYDYIDSVKKFEHWSEIYEWYVELFYFSGKKYLRTVHFSSGFTLYFGNVDESFMHGLGFRIRNELFKYYVSDKEMTNSLINLFSESFLNFYSRIRDKSRINSPIIKSTSFDAGNSLFASVIDSGVIDTVKLNKAVNSRRETDNGSSRSDNLKKLISSLYSDKKSLPINIKSRYDLNISQYELHVYTES